MDKKGSQGALYKAKGKIGKSKPGKGASRGGYCRNARSVFKAWKKDNRNEEHKQELFLWRNHQGFQLCCFEERQDRNNRAKRRRQVYTYEDGVWNNRA